MPGEPPTQQHDPTTTAAQPSEEEMRAAYEAELNRITSTDMILQTAVSLLNIGGRRLGLDRPSQPGPSAPEGGSGAAGERDLEQVRDAIDAVRALMPILERRMPREIAPLRDAVSQLQMAYAREVQVARDPAPGAPHGGQPSPGEPTPAQEQQAPQAEGEKPAAGPAESSGRLWVPGR
jgi:hypothetical protein